MEGEGWVVVVEEAWTRPGGGGYPSAGRCIDVRELGDAVSTFVPFLLYFFFLFFLSCNRLFVSLVVVCRKVVPRGLNGASELVEKRETMLERVKKEEGERATTRERPENGQATSDTVIQEETRDKIRGERLPAC